MEEKRNLTFEELMASFSRIEKQQEENAKQQEENAKRQEEYAKRQEENAKQQEENAKKREKEWAKIRQLQEENAKGFAELREQQKTNEEKRNKELAELEKFIKDIGKNVDGMNKSAGLIAEEQVIDYLTRTMTFGENHYDAIQQNVHSKRTLSNGEKIEAEYDVLLTNDVSVCIIETKSRAREDDIKDLVENKAAKFKKLLPIFANHKIYLGFAAMSFEKGVKEEAKKLGIGILKPKGDFVEVYDKNLKVY